MSISVSARQYFWALAALGLVVFLLLAIHQISRTEQANAAIAEEKRHSAAKEMTRAVKHVVESLNGVVVGLSQWDEVHQQLSDPTYYVYWRESRKKNQDYFPTYVTAFELYGKDGAPLIRMPNHPMPAQVPSPHFFLQAESGEFYAFSEIVSRVPGEGRVGYIGIKVNFVDALNRLYQFSLVEGHSVTIKSTAGRLSPEEIFSQLDYRTVEDVSESPLGKILLDTLKDYFLFFVALLTAFYLLLLVLMIRPLVQLNRHIHELREGKRGHDRERMRFLPSIKELDTAWQSLDTYQQELDAVQRELDSRNAELWELAHVDGLTGASNRLAFDRDWKELQHVAANTRLDVSLALFDCDFFKAINDSYGHEAGDKVIQTIARQIQGVLRDGDRLYRIGGDEFISIFVNCTVEQAREIAERCVAVVQSEALSELGIRETLKISVGLSHAAGNDAANLSELPRQADVAMYHAKSSTRNKVVDYTPQLEDDAYALVSSYIVSRVLDAIDNGNNLRMHYQAIVEANSHKVSHYEALVRIDDGDDLITTNDIFPIVARRRLEVELDKAVIRRVEADLGSGGFPTDVGVAINVSAALLAMNNFCEHFDGLVPYLKKRAIIIEVTETTIITHLHHASKCLQKLRDSGFTIALDDFGSGYSSLRYLSSMPVDMVKFDISMIKALQDGTRSRTIIYDAAKLIHNAGYMLVAEGIEDEEILHAVMPLQPGYLQGYFFERPRPLEELNQ